MRWKPNPTVKADPKGFTYYRKIRWRDSRNRQWEIQCIGNSMVVSAPDGRSGSSAGEFAPEAFEAQGLSTFLCSLEKLNAKAWECYRVLQDTGRCGISQHHAFYVIIHKETGHWASLVSRVTDDIETVATFSDGSIALRWCDESDDPPLRVYRHWVASDGHEGLETHDDPPIYQLEWGYPIWFRFWADPKSPDPNLAEWLGWLSIAWDLCEATSQGGRARSDRSSIPSTPGRQVWRKGTGPDVWFPVPRHVRFRWDETVRLIPKGKPSRGLSPVEAAAACRTGPWKIILTRKGDGSYIGSMLIEPAHEPFPDGLWPRRP